MAGVSRSTAPTTYRPSTSQNKRVPREDACFVCHTSYAMYGDIEAKLKGLQHVWVNYVTGPPDELALYEPYQNRECLYCHASARSFEENDFHLDSRTELETNEFSCLECHTPVHDIAELDTLDQWNAVATP